MKKGMNHSDKLVSLKRIQGQVGGLIRMVEGQRYCIDILNAASAAVGALKRFEANVLKDHLNGCVNQAFAKSSKKEKENKINEICCLLTDSRKH